LSAALPEKDSQGLLLGGDVRPHITLTQQFVAVSDLEAALDRVASMLAVFNAFRLTVTGPDRNGRSVWMAIEPSPALIELHRRLMDGLEPFERTGGTSEAFAGAGGRPGDVAWVAGFRKASSYDAFKPHITLGHASTPPDVEPITFDAITIAACQLGRFCTCLRLVRMWELRR
jgi:2'-5' RNA ligase